MTKEQAIETLKELQSDKDPEMAHRKADLVLCQFLKSLGHRNVVVEWNKIRKWYA